MVQATGSALMGIRKGCVASGYCVEALKLRRFSGEVEEPGTGGGRLRQKRSPLPHLLGPLAMPVVSFLCCGPNCLTLSSVEPHATRAQGAKGLLGGLCLGYRPRKN
jgi:hypothetical protein